MNGTDEKRKRFELLMKQVDLPAGIVEPHFIDGFIDQVEISRMNREWHITITKDTLVPAPVFKAFCLHIRDKMSHIAKISFTFNYGSAVSEADIVTEYWNLFLEWVHQQIPSVNGWMNRATQEVESGLLTLTMSDAMALELARKKQIDQAITTYYDRYFKLPLKVKMLVGESNREELEKFEQKKREEERVVIENMMSMIEAEMAPVEEEEGDVRLQMGYEIKEPAVPIQEVQDEEKKITLQGTVFGLDKKNSATVIHSTCSI